VEGNRRARVRRGSFAMSFYPPLLFFGGLFVLVGAWEGDLIGYPMAAVFVFTLMALLRHYSALWELGLAAGEQNELLRYFLARSSITVATVAPLVLVGIAHTLRLNRFSWYLSIAAAVCSSLLTARYEFHRLASYYPGYSVFYLTGCIDLFAVVGTVVPLALSIKALRLDNRRLPQGGVRRAASALHGESDWLPIRVAREWFPEGGIIVGEAYRADSQSRGGKVPLLRYDGLTGSGHVLLFAGSGGYKTTATVIPSALEWPTGLVSLDPSVEVLPRVRAARRNLGHRVVRFNLLDWIDVSSDWRAPRHPVRGGSRWPGSIEGVQRSESAQSAHQLACHKRHRKVSLGNWTIMLSANVPGRRLLAGRSGFILSCASRFLRASL
jgi:type IV secretory system conjugative DNA transfer VirD4/TraG family protein